MRRVLIFNTYENLMKIKCHFYGYLTSHCKDVGIDNWSKDDKV